MSSPASGPPLTPEFLAENKQAQLWGAIITTRILAFAAVILRVIARRISGARFWWDDWIIIATAIIILIPEFGASMAIVYLGTGRHLAWVEANQPWGLPAFSKLAYMDELTYTPVIAPVKCSILCLYIRLFGIRRWFRYICYALIAVSVLWGVTTFLLFALQCKNIPDAWSPGVRTNCFDYATLFLGTNVPNVIIDFLILAVPIYPVWTLKVPLTQKVFISGILAVGTAEVAISIVRVVTLSALNYEDPTWDLAEASLWSELEVNIGVICCCLPVFGPLLPRRILEKMRSSVTTDKKSHGSDTIHMGYMRQRNVSNEAQQPFAKDDSDWNGIRHTTDIYVSDRAANDMEAQYLADGQPKIGTQPAPLPPQAHAIPHPPPPQAAPLPVKGRY